MTFDSTNYLLGFTGLPTAIIHANCFADLVKKTKLYSLFSLKGK